MISAHSGDDWSPRRALHKDFGTDDRVRIYLTLQHVVLFAKSYVCLPNIIGISRARITRSYMLDMLYVLYLYSTQGLSDTTPPTDKVKTERRLYTNIKRSQPTTTTTTTSVGAAAEERERETYVVVDFLLHGRGENELELSMRDYENVLLGTH